MKNRCFHRVSITDLLLQKFIIVATLFLFSSSALAIPELDRKYSLETVGFLKTWDNVDGLFNEYVSQGYKEYFADASRFTLIDISKSDTVLSRSSIPYNRLLEDTEVLAQVARAMRVQTLLRTKVYKEGGTYRFSIDWLHSPQMDLIANETFVLEEPKDGKAFGIGDVKGALYKALERLVAKVPFLANVSGRDANSVTVNVGQSFGLKRGDTLVIGTLDEVKRHPMLKAIVDWRITQVGKVVVDEVDGGIGFTHVIEESPGKQIARYQKVIQHLPLAVQPTVIKEGGDVAKLDPPSYGWVSGGIWAGGMSRDHAVQDPNVKAVTGGGLIFGGKTLGQLWLDRNWFSELGFSFGVGSYNQNKVGDEANKMGSSSSTTFGWLFNLGYNYFVTGDFHGPKATGKFGYRNDHYGLTTSANDRLGGSTFGSFYIGLGGDLPMRGNYGLLMNADIGIFNEVSETGYTTGPASGAANFAFSFGGYYRFDMRMAVKFMLDIVAQSGEFNATATGTDNLNHKVITFGPSIVYYF